MTVSGSRQAGPNDPSSAMTASELNALYRSTSRSMFPRPTFNYGD